MTEILLPCPFCGGEAESNGYFNGGTGNSWEIVTCSKCGVSQPTTKYYSMPQAIAAWNRRAEPENKPLTLDELRGMIGNPVWVTHKDGSGGRWGIVNQYDIGLCADISAGTAYWFDDYCGTIAYRHKPEGSENK